MPSNREQPSKIEGYLDSMPEERGHSWTIVHCIISIPFPEALASLSQVVLKNLLLFLWTNKEKHVIILY